MCNINALTNDSNLFTSGKHMAVVTSCDDGHSEFDFLSQAVFFQDDEMIKL